MTRSCDGRSFATLILTHGRPRKQATVNSLRKCGYTGRIVLVLDDLDTTEPEYREAWPDLDIAVFNRKQWEDFTDVADARDVKQGSVVYARNASFEIARDLGLTHFIQLDDDYDWFGYRAVIGGTATGQIARNLDRVFEALVDLLEDTGAICVALSGGVDHVGGAGGNISKGLLRKAMNSFLMRTDKPVEFLGRINEDTTTPVVGGMRGDLYFTATKVQLTQPPMGKAEGGAADLYRSQGSYVQQFYTVLFAPSCVTLRHLRAAARWQSFVESEYAFPKILSPSHRKERAA